ncbi:MAG TPA: DUF1570 domain-containing protein [Kofleriaceae bacterium]|nr:DUF1570 domain-containing protein [Kofleriaceae bacterium]
MVRIQVYAVIGAMLVACGAAIPPVPSKGGPDWTEVTTDHFTVWSDAGPAHVRELVENMEHIRQVIVGVAFPSEVRGKTLVIALRDDAELTAFSSTQQARAWATPASSPLFQPTVVLSAFSNFLGNDRTVAHELTHAISYGVIHHQPRWLAEGMAEFFETMRVDATTADVGVAPSYRGAPLRMARLVPISKLLMWGAPSEDESREYSTAWALFTFLMNTDRGELLRYMQLQDKKGSSRDKTTAEQAEQLWREAFPSLPLDDVDSKLRRWLVTGAHVVSHFNVRRQDFATSERALGDADVYAIRSMLEAIFADHRDRARAAATESLAAEPSNVLGRLFAAALNRAEITIDQAHAMTAAHGDDWRAWWLTVEALTAAHGDAADIDNARSNACALIAKNPALAAPEGLCPDELDGPS